MARRVQVDRARCLGHGVCALLAPEMFSIAADGIAVVNEDPLGEGKVLDVQDAIDNCPTAALHWQDSDIPATPP